jgi:hypothetical protein
MFYRLVRTLYDAPTALVAALLLAVSLLDMTASRVANVESHVRLWAILPFFGLAVALRTHRVRHFLLTGFAVAGAMLTYETLIPIVAAVLTLAIGAALRDWRAWRAWLPRLAALMTAPAAVAAVTIDYLFGRMGYYLDFRGPATDSTFGEQLARGVEGLFKTFYSAPLNDAVYNRDGPIINGLLVPLLVLGILYAVVRARRQSSAFALTWLAWAFLPVPVILHTPLPRVLYPGLPVLYIFIAIALVVIFRTIANAVQLPRLAAPIGVLALSGFALLNLTIWFQEVQGTPDEIRRRQVSEIVAANVAPDGPLWMPHYRLNETVDVERETMGLMIRERRRTTNAGEYGLVLYNDLLPALSRQGASYLQLKVLIDNSQPALPEERQRIIDAFNRCYPMAGVTPTTYFDLYHLTHTDLSSPACRSAPLKLAPPPGAIEGGAAARIAIGWSLDSASASQSELTCRRDRPDVVWIEAESFVTLSAWITDTRFVTGWSGQGYLADDWRSEYAATGADVPKPGTYRLWVRTYRRQADDFPAFMEINGQTLTFAEPDPAALNVWRWQSLADLRLNAGPLLIRLTRPFDQARAPFIALFVDTIVLSADPKFDPNHDERRLPALHTRGADAGQQRQGSFTIQLASGRYQCVVTVSDGDRLVDSSGATGITSDPVYFEVKP